MALCFKEYGKSLSKMGGNIREMSSVLQNENKSLSIYNYNINICETTVTPLQSLKVPFQIKNERESLINFFNDLIFAYSLKRDSPDNQSKIIDIENYNKGQKILKKKSKKIKLLLLSILLKCNQHLLQTDLESK